MDFVARLKDLTSAPANAAAAALAKMRDSARGAGDSLTKLGSSGAKEIDRVANGAGKLTERVKGSASSFKGLGAVFSSVASTATRAIDRMNAKKLNIELKEEQAKLNRLKAAMRNLNMGSVVDLETARKLRGEINESQGRVAQLSGRLASAGVAGEKFSGSTSRASKALGLVKAGALAAVASVALLGAATAAAGANFVAYGTRLALGPIGMERLQMASFRLQMNMRRLFLGIDASPVIRVANRVADFFDRSNVSGQLLRSVFERSFGALFSLLERAAPFVENFALGVIYGALLVENAWLKAQIALVPLTVKLEKLVGRVDWMEVAFTAGTLAAIGLAAGVVLVGASMLFAAAPVLIMGAAVYVAYEAVTSLIDALKRLVGAGDETAKATSGIADRFREATSNLGSKDAASKSGRAIGDGLVSGMLSKIGEVTTAGAALAKAADKGVRNEAQIRSPARKFRVSADYMVQGVTTGLDAGATKVQRAAETALVPSLPSSATGSLSGQAAAAPSRPQGHITNIFQLSGTPDQKAIDDIEAAVERSVRRVFGDAMIERGAA